MARKCFEVPRIGAGVDGDQHLPDIPASVGKWKVVNDSDLSTWGVIIVGDPIPDIPAATWEGTEAEAASRWNISEDVINNFIP